MYRQSQMAAKSAPSSQSPASQDSQRVHTILGEGEAERPVADLPPEALRDQQLQVRFVVDDQNACPHPFPMESAIAIATSCFSRGKSTGFVTNLAAPRASAAAIVFPSP